ncbi:helix-hairpin-helix domain-containing protein [Carnobacterium divergens]|uniref:Competence protein comEA n=2 Tax=Carnobacterium divergens TaxID=2748 RepID=A0A0R2HNM5_CARDV|nr:helix-hairpin-helix domain-containing protein [Carnobacterium divergens]KRN54496.1 competence protein comEA [Carnobacterium divergens DSM 20623]MDO0873981.1 helix-hairpin-helix domain-containing protein [Carnobacterium divergens]MDT1957480.1 helix-hairpin-helix domain-containing protein [Carnobacterium divergens]MDT1973683.1 helix-hairpin-helix domain-containing protein [Carnobacterium divergens]MDT2011026.1 helix-hairpin-helix domain-containing protein [Carnobacterium divergens]
MNDMKKWIQKNRLFLSVIALSLVLVVMISTLIILLFTQQSSENIVVEPLEESRSKEEQQLEKEESSKKKEPSPEKLVVDIKGAVKNPGVYGVTSDMRLIDAINLAGGFTGEADQSQMNLALRLTDQLMIYVPKNGEELTMEQSLKQPVKSGEKVNEEVASKGLKVNLNTASVAELQTLAGVGLKKAEDIIRYREENGSFQQIEELTKVSGIGEKTYEALKEQLTVDE